jgi:hypothetical protein
MIDSLLLETPCYKGRTGNFTHLIHLRSFSVVPSSIKVNPAY